MQWLGIWLLHALADLLSHGWDAVPRGMRNRLARQPWRGGGYPPGASLWARLNRPPGWFGG